MGTYGKAKRTRVWLRGAIVHFNYNLLNGSGLHLVHAEADSGCVFKTNVSWRNVNGILIRTRNSQTFIHFRRRPWYMRSHKG